MTNDLTLQLLDEIVDKVKNIVGVDSVCFIKDNNEIIKEHKIRPVKDYLKAVFNLIKSKSESNNENNYLEKFHTQTFLNESGLIIISHLDNQNKDNLYLVVVAGENQAVDLINLLKKCKECRRNYLKEVVL